MADSDQVFVKELVKRNRYLSLATVDGGMPWVAPLEYLSDENLNLYYFSTESAAHSQHLSNNQAVAFTIFDAVQPEYEPAQVVRIAGVQGKGIARKLEVPFPDFVADQIEAWKLPMPPYCVYRITAKRWYIPVIKDGVNHRLEVTMELPGGA